MSHVVTLISNPAAPALDGAALGRAAETLADFGAIDSPLTLAEGIAADIMFSPFGGHDEAGLWAALRAALDPAPLDIVVQPLAARRKRLLIADMDSTMIEQECIDELAAEVGLKDKVAAITERAMRGEIAFEPALRERVGLLAGLPVAVIHDLIARVITLQPGGRVLVATMRKAGAHTALVSGGFTLFTGPLAAKLGFHEHRSNRLTVSDGKLAGRVEEPILGRAAKRAALEELIDSHGLARAETLAVGDGANDLDMLAAAGLGVAFRAKPAVAAAAHARIEHGDLTALLYLQGYRAAEFTSA